MLTKVFFLISNEDAAVKVLTGLKNQQVPNENIQAVNQTNFDNIYKPDAPLRKLLTGSVKIFDKYIKQGKVLMLVDISKDRADHIVGNLTRANPYTVIQSGIFNHAL